LISDKSTDPEIVSTLVDLKSEQSQNPLTSETCGDNVENNLEGSATVASEGDCSSTSIAGAMATAGPTANSTTTDSNPSNSTTIINSNIANTDSIISNTTTGNRTFTANSTTTEPSQICNGGANDNTNSTIGDANCAPEPETCGHDTNNNVTGVSCPTSQPVVVIDSAVDEAGNSLSQDDSIGPQKVTFTFSANVNETSENSGEQVTQDYQYECALDDESFSSCNSPVTYEMQAGKHDFTVRLVS
jgi:hypothetical protein